MFETFKRKVIPTSQIKKSLGRITFLQECQVIPFLEKEIYPMKGACLSVSCLTPKSLWGSIWLPPPVIFPKLYFPERW